MAVSHVCEQTAQFCAAKRALRGRILNWADAVAFPSLFFLVFG
jgi:hypothetical protein